MSRTFSRVVLLAGVGLMAHWSAAALAGGSQRVLQMLDYVGVDYPATVSNGEIIDPVEYAEMLEFSGEIVELLKAMPDRPGKATLIGSARSIRDAVKQRLAGDAVAGLTTQLKETVIDHYQIVVAPGRVPDMSSVQALYETNCASCHGLRGYGDGPGATGMKPAPSNFHDRARQNSRSIYDLYNTISLGVPKTPMESFGHLEDEQRWALAFLVGRFPATREQTDVGRTLWQQGVLHDNFRTLAQLTGTSFAKAANNATRSGYDAGEGVAVLAYLRSDPDVLEISDHAAIDKSIAMLVASVELARAGDRKAARKAALSAYLDGFELAEGSVSVADRGLKRKIEKEMLRFRGLAAKGPLQELENSKNNIVALLNEAKKILSSTEASPIAAFSGSFIILLREGVEAILVLAAILAALIKTGRRDAIKYIHFGWVAAVVLGIFTWWIADNVITISGASRELTEGFAALFAAVILVYVGFWLHNASSSKRWKQYVEHKVDHAVEGSTLWVLALVAFLAVYREMFETVLFYQSMWLQIEPGAQQAFVLGILVAIVFLVILSFLIFRFGTKLPIKLFFQINAVLLFFLAVVFSGQGIAALQEAGMVSIRSIRFPQVEMLGIYPTVQSLGLQMFVLFVGAALLIYRRKTN